MRASLDRLDAWDLVAVATGLALGLAGGVVALLVVAAEGPAGLLVIPFAVCAAAGALMFAGMSSAVRRKRSNGKERTKRGPYRDAAEVVPDAPAPHASPARPVEDDEEDVQPVVGSTVEGLGEPRSKVPVWVRRTAAVVVCFASLAGVTWISVWYHLGR